MRPNPSKQQERYATVFLQVVFEIFPPKMLYITKQIRRNMEYALKGLNKNPNAPRFLLSSSNSLFAKLQNAGAMMRAAAQSMSHTVPSHHTPRT